MLTKILFVLIREPNEREKNRSKKKRQTRWQFLKLEEILSPLGFPEGHNLFYPLLLLLADLLVYIPLFFVPFGNLFYSPLSLSQRKSL
mmetsp:Transcript_22739/g.25651  ORF Transcript_22739/g.25651 Transcript_22739/m.25651 type:complete len:88 (-) Transcript_22739:912-1175(-)